MTVVASRSGGVNKVCTREAESMQNVVATKDLLIFALLVPLLFSNAHIKKKAIGVELILENYLLHFWMN